MKIESKISINMTNKERDDALERYIREVADIPDSWILVSSYPTIGDYVFEKKVIDETKQT